MKKKVNELERKKLFKVVYIAILAIIIISILFIGRNSFLQYYLNKYQVKKLEKQVVRLTEENDSLRTANKELKNNADAVEKIAREKFGLIKPGEKVYRFLPPEENEKKKN